MNLENVAKQISNDIDQYIIKTYDDGHRWHLGASQIGDECKRKLWYIFRWCFRNTFKNPENHARMQRLFNRGHREEARFIEWLKGIGAEVWTHDEHGNQFRTSEMLSGHFGGSLDGIAKLPPKYGINEPVLLEFKTSGTGRAFTEVTKQGMRAEKPVHFAQTSMYGSDPKYKLKYCLYFMINKNDDSLHTELVELDYGLADNLRKKAELIVLSDTPPQRLSDSPTYITCAYCAAHQICHKGKPPEINCRSCKYAKPYEHAEWFCNQHNSIIPREYVPKGCPKYEPIST